MLITDLFSWFCLIAAGTEYYCPLSCTPEPGSQLSDPKHKHIIDSVVIFQCRSGYSNENLPSLLRSFYTTSSPVTATLHPAPPLLLQDLSAPKEASQPLSEDTLRFIVIGMVRKAFFYMNAQCFLHAGDLPRYLLHPQRICLDAWRGS